MASAWQNYIFEIGHALSLPATNPFAGTQIAGAAIMSIIGVLDGALNNSSVAVDAKRSANRNSIIRIAAYASVGFTQDWQPALDQQNNWYGWQELEGLVIVRHCMAHTGYKVMSNYLQALKGFEADLNSSNIANYRGMAVKPYFKIINTDEIQLLNDAVGRIDSLGKHLLKFAGDALNDPTLGS